MKESKLMIATSVEEALHETAELFVHAVSDASKKHERVSVALSGGNTPKGLYLLLSDRSQSYYSRVPWEQVDFFWGDERFVPPTDENSNYLMSKKTLLDRVPVSHPRIHRFKTENISAEESARDYQRELQKFFHQENLSVLPAFDFILLGMGPDGHTASLFPDVALENLENENDWVKSFYVPHLKNEQPVRLSFTPQLINAAKRVVFLVTGKDKADAFERVNHSHESPYTVPAKLIRPNKGGKLFWVVDQEVASKERLAS